MEKTAAQVRLFRLFQPVTGTKISVQSDIQRVIQAKFLLKNLKSYQDILHTLIAFLMS